MPAIRISSVNSYYLTDSRYQLDIINVNVQAHLPYLVAAAST